MVSDKAVKLSKYTSAFDNWAIEKKWLPLKTYHIDIPICHADQEVFHFTDHARKAWEQIAVQQGKAFVRACPEEPRHGVLESVAVFSEGECVEAVNRIGRKMIEVGELQGAMIVQPFIPAHASAVYAPDKYILIGRDHDGITAGKDGLRIALPIKESEWVNNIFTTLGIDKEKIELEFVSRLRNVDDDMSNIMDAMHTKHQSSMDNYITQLRGCEQHVELSTPPDGVDTNGSVPNGVVGVTEIFRIEKLEDIEQMEEWVNAGVAEGGVVSHPDGTLLSHAAAHCRAHSVPYIVSSVEIGDTWTEVSSGWVTKELGFEPQPYDPSAYQKEFVEGLSVGLYNWTRMYGWLSNHFHQFVSKPMINPAETAFLGGVFVGWLVNATLAVSLGEMRNARGHRRGNHPAIFGGLGALFKGKWVAQGIADLNFIEQSPPATRSSYFYTMENTPLTMESMHHTLSWLVKMYESNWSGSYGGMPYANSTRNALELLECARKYVSSGTKDDFFKVIDKANATENNMHNCGFFFNKFMLKVSLDMGTDADGCPSDLDYLFMPYYAAYAATTKRGMKPKNLHDISETMQYLSKHGVTYWRKNPVYIDKNAPQILKDSIKSMIDEERGNLLHSGGGAITNPSNMKFIMCGHEKCSVCYQHNTFLEQNAEQHRRVLIKRVLGKECLSFIDSGVQYDMYPVNESSGTTDDTIEFLDAVCESISQKEDIEFDVIEQAYTLLDPSLELNEYYSLTLAKFMAKKGPENLVEFVKGKTTEELVDEESILLSDVEHIAGVVQEDSEQMKEIGEWLKEHEEKEVENIVLNGTDLFEEIAEAILGGEEE
tara:strand:+ start:838 stop:3315 length:2478 start_codon:yes stop_codon:yes gene_type:complete